MKCVKLFKIKTSSDKSLQGLSCKVLGLFTHMVTLAAFLAMLTEAATIYVAIVLVFDTHVSRAVVKSALFCYGELTNHFSGFP